MNRMTIPRRLSLLAILICWGFLGFAQGPTKRFRWDWRAVERDGWSSIAESKTLSAHERVGLTEIVASQLRPFRSEMNIDTEQQLRDLAARTSIKAVDLDSNGPKQYLAQGSGGFLCSPTGNCETWVFRSDGEKYSMILHRIATQTFTIQPTVTNGFHDLVLGQHGSATEQGLTLYRFDGSKYRRIACYKANWTILGKDGEYHGLKEPRLTPVICTIR
jgi:hypothetical protein